MSELEPLMNILPSISTSVPINLVVPGPVTSKDPYIAKPGLVGIVLIPTLSLKYV